MSSSPKRRRPWRVALPLIVFLALAAAWSAFWYRASAEVGTILEEWRAREAQAGRNYTCDRQSIGGFPFRFELLCSDAVADLASNDPRVALKAANIHIAAQVYDPTLLIAEIGSPLTIAVTGQAPVHADWSLLQVSLRGRPPAPDRISMAVDDAVINASVNGANATILRGKHIELHARIGSGTVMDHPVLDLAATLTGTAAPSLHPLTQKPLDLTAVGVLRGLDDLRPMPLPERLRQLQAAGGRLEIKQARIQQGDVTAIAAGSLGLKADGRLDGKLDLTVSGLERVLPLLGIDQLAPQNDNLTPTFNALDRLIPGLGQMARQRAGAGLAIGLAFIGKPAQLEGRKALALPLRFDDGDVYLGPVRIGTVGPLF
jgi:hypothetical protein